MDNFDSHERLSQKKTRTLSLGKQIALQQPWDIGLAIVNWMAWRSLVMFLITLALLETVSVGVVVLSNRLPKWIEAARKDAAKEPNISAHLIGTYVLYSTAIVGAIAAAVFAASRIIWSADGKLFPEIPAGTYWIITLGVVAMAGLIAFAYGYKTEKNRIKQEG